MLLRSTVVIRAAELAAEFGEDIDEALARFEDAGGQDGGQDAYAWVSVAFLFGRHLRGSSAAAASLG